MLDTSVRDHFLTIVEAPSGFGKTTALALWVSGREPLTGWMSLRHDSHTTSEVLRLVMGALRQLYPQSAGLASLSVEQAGESTDLSSTIAAIIDAVPSETTIVIDDAQRSGYEALSRLIVPLARYSGGKIRFIICGTHSLSSWLAREIVAGDATCVPSAQLLFTPSEVGELLARTDSSPSLIADTLWQETGGWPVAVHLLIQIGRSTGPGGLDAHVSPHLLTDYIEQDVLSQLRPELRQFIIDTSVCDMVSSELVTHIADHPLAGSLLEESARTGLFLDRFSKKGDKEYFRWHTIFARSCREIAERTDPARYRLMHRRAAEWMSDNYPTEAIYHARMTGDSSFVVETIETVWLALITGGFAPVLERECLQLPPSTDDDASLLHIRAVCRDMAGDHASALALSARADAAQTRASDTERSDITRVFADLMILSEHADLDASLDEAERLLVETELSRSLRIHGTFIAGWTRLRLRIDPARAVKLLMSAARAAREAGYDTVASRASAMVAFALAFVGRLNQARQILDGLLSEDDFHGFDPFDGSMNLWTLAFIDYWQGDMDGALAAARKLDETGGPLSSNAGMGRIYFACAAALGDPDALDEAPSVLRRVSDRIQHGIPWHLYKAVAAASVHWARGDRSAAVSALEVVGDHTGITTTLAMAADMWRRIGYPNQAIRVLELIDPALLVSYTEASACFTRAVIAWDRGDRDAAHALLGRCLDAAVPESVGAPFARLDESARALLSDFVAEGTVHESFIASQLALSAPNGPSAGCEPLSARESEVFAYLGSTLTAADIAELLHISPATVRSHQRSIYRKLNVTNRRDAVRAGNGAYPRS